MSVFIIRVEVWKLVAALNMVSWLENEVMKYPSDCILFSQFGWSRTVIIIRKYVLFCLRETGYSVIDLLDGFFDSKAEPV